MVKAIQNIVVETGTAFLDLILPPRCIVSGATVDRQGMLAPDIWGKLEFMTQPQCDRCGIPFEYEVQGAQSWCAPCHENPPLYARARAALKYNETSRDLILGFKHGDQMHAIEGLKAWIGMAAAPFLEHTDIIAPVPLHYWRMVRRRYNQASVLGKALSKESGCTFYPDLLWRTKSTPPQGHMNAMLRRDNVKGAFSVNKKFMGALAGQSVLLVDDVYTSGATVGECSKILLRAGAAEVNVVTLARVIKETTDIF